MTKKLSSVQVRETTEKLAQLYVDSRLNNVVIHYQAITGTELTDIQKYEVRKAALDEFNAWIAALRKPTDERT